MYTHHFASAGVWPSLPGSGPCRQQGVGVVQAAVLLPQAVRLPEAGHA